MTAQSSPIHDDNVFVLKARVRQETTTAPLALTFEEPFREGRKEMVRLWTATVPASDVLQALTTEARSLAPEGQPVDGVVVLDVRHRNTQITTSTPWAFQLASGAQIIVPPSAVMDVLTSQLRAKVRARTQPGATERAAGGSGGSPEAVIRAKCAKEWPDDFVMRKYCQDQQASAIEKLAGRSMSQSDDHRTIRARCSREWPDDYVMRNFCEEQQLKALSKLR